METRRRYRTARPLSRIQSNYRKWKDWEAGDYFIGEFIKKEDGTFQGQPSPKWHFKYLDASFTVKDKEGRPIKMDETKNFTLNSNATLNGAMEEVESGQIIEVKYEGQDSYVKDGITVTPHKVTVSLLEEDIDEDEEVTL